jgi:hypothetical protein
MKKVVLAVLMVGLAVGLGAGQAFAQEKKVEFSLNAGAMTLLGGDISFAGVLLTLSPQVDIHVAKGFMISPEAMFLTDVEFSGVIALPGVLLNYVGRGFFAGAGVVFPVSISDGFGTGSLLPKLNLGYRGRHVNLTAYLITDTAALFSLNLIGASLGYRF